MKFETTIPKVVDVIPVNEILVSNVPVFKPEVIVADKPVGVIYSLPIIFKVKN